MKELDELALQTAEALIDKFYIYTIYLFDVTPADVAPIIREHFTPILERYAALVRDYKTRGKQLDDAITERDEARREVKRLTELLNHSNEGQN